jgi:hypothetical protein
MIALAAPLGLVALAALALPVIIHLIRRAEEREMQFAALRWLSERSGPATRWRLHEPLLLALRMLLLATIALLMALPFWRSRAEPGVPWVAVAPGLDAMSARGAVDAPAAEWHWLASGFPRVEERVLEPAVPLASLVRQLDADLASATALTVVIPREIGGLDGERLRLGRAVDWRVVDGSSPRNAHAAAAAPIRIAVRESAGADAEADERIVVDALAAAWRTAGLTTVIDAVPADAPIPADVDWLFSLGGAPTAPVERWVEDGGVALVSQIPATDGVVLMTDDNGAALLRERPLGRGRMLTTPAALTATAMPALLAPDFPRRIREVMSAPVTPPDRAVASAVPPGRRDMPAPGSLRPLDRGLVVLAAVLFLAERMWATRRRGVTR